MRCVMILLIDNAEANATTRSFGVIQDRIIVTAERKKADLLEEQENEYDARARARWWEEKEGTDLVLDHPLTERNERRVSANLAGATQPLGRRAIFLGHDKFVLYLWSPPVTFSSHHSLQRKCLIHVGTLVAAFMSP